MRVTQGMMTSSFLNDLFKANERFQKTAKQMSSNKRITRPSDDAIGTTRSLKVRKDISELDQFEKNVRDAQSYLKVSESSLSQIDTMYLRFIEIAEGTLDGALSDEDRMAYASEAKQLQNELLQVANNNYAGRYVFGGFNTTTPPFTYNIYNGNLAYNGVDIITNAGALKDEDKQVLTYQLAHSVKFELGYSGVDLFGTGEDNLYNVVGKFVKDLEAGNFDNSEKYVSQFTDGHNHILALEADIGAKVNRLDYMEDRYADDSLTLEERRMNIEDIDMAETISDLNYQEVIYQAILHANSMILQPSLLDYL